MTRTQPLAFPGKPSMSTILLHRLKACSKRSFGSEVKITHRRLPWCLHCLRILPLLISSLPTVIQAQFTYTTNDGTITITGYYGSAVAVIPGTINGLPVTRIGDSAFANSSVISVGIPNSVTNIGNSAFQSSQLGSIAIPDGVGTIGNSAFASCFYLTSATISGTVGKIGRQAFGTCEALTSIMVDPQNASYSSVDGVLYDKNQTTLIAFPPGVSGSYAMPNGVIHIEEFAFYACNYLTNVILDDQLADIGTNAFLSSALLAGVSIPGSVTNIGLSAFGSCASLTEINVASNNTAYSSIDGVLFDQRQTTLIQCPGGKGETYVVPNGVTNIADYAFYGCLQLRNATIPDNVLSIGSAAFETCIYLTNVTIGNGVAIISDYAFINSGLTSALIPDSVKSIGDSAFDDCSSLTSVKIGDGVTDIGIWAFYGCSRLSSVIMGSSVSRIGANAFYNCGALTTINIPASTTSIGDSAIAYSGVTNITIPAAVTNIGNSAFAGCAHLPAITVDTLNSVYSSTDGVLLDKNQTTLIRCPGGKVGAFTAPASVTGMLDAAFNQCRGLTSVTLGNSLTNISATAFASSTNLASVSIGINVTSIGNSAFSGCSSLTNVIIPNSVTSIGSFAFATCRNLTGISIGSHVASIAEEAFWNCTKLTSITIPDSVRALGYYSLGVCTNLTRATIGNGLTNLADAAFQLCTHLTNVTIGAGVARIGTNAFNNCFSLASMYFQGNAPILDGAVFTGDTNATVYYLPGTTGWGSTFGGRPAVLWNPQVQTGSATFGIRTNRFGFTISGSSNLVIVVEAATNLVNPVWSAVGTNRLTNGASYFSDSRWTNYSSRFYRLRAP